MTIEEVAEYLGCSVREARAPWRRLMKREAEIMAEMKAEEEKRKKRKAAAAKSPRRILPEWCKPFWERRDGVQHIVYCSAKRKRDKEPITAFWVWFNGHPVAKSDTLDGAKGLAALRAMLYDTYVWDASQWEKELRRNPQIAEVRKACGV